MRVAPSPRHTGRPLSVPLNIQDRRPGAMNRYKFGATRCLPGSVIVRTSDAESSSFPAIALRARYSCLVCVLRVKIGRHYGTLAGGY
jgi:hypothetical protein